MTNVHAVRPTDLVALVAFDGHVYPNEAMTRDRIGGEASPHPLETALEQWFSFATGRHTWISVKGATLRGLVSARKRGANTAWEIDCLIDAADEDAGVATSLLERVIEDAGRAGAEKVFLRVPVASTAVERACRAGFAAYGTERLMFRRGRVEMPAQTSMPLRRRARSDAEPLFRLYNRWAPLDVRRAEAATFREWQAALDRISPERGTRQRVAERNGRIAGWVRAAATSYIGRFDVIADPGHPDLFDGLIDAALAMLKDQTALFVLVPEFAAGLRDRLERRGFATGEEFATLARQTTERVEMPGLAAVQASTLA